MLSTNDMQKQLMFRGYNVLFSFETDDPIPKLRVQIINAYNAYSLSETQRNNLIICICRYLVAEGFAENTSDTGAAI